MVGFMAIMAQAERKMIGERTKAALQAAKARGKRLGNPNLTDRARAMGREASARARAGRAAERAADVMPTIRELQAAGTTSLRGLAAGLNERGIPAPRGGRWHASSVRNALALAGEA